MSRQSVSQIVLHSWIIFYNITFLVNSEGQAVYVKWHLKTDQGIKNLPAAEADRYRSRTQYPSLISSFYAAPFLSPLESPLHPLWFSAEHRTITFTAMPPPQPPHSCNHDPFSSTSSHSTFSLNISFSTDSHQPTLTMPLEICIMPSVSAWTDVIDNTYEILPHRSDTIYDLKCIPSPFHSHQEKHFHCLRFAPSSFFPYILHTPLSLTPNTLDNFAFRSVQATRTHPLGRCTSK